MREYKLLLLGNSLKFSFIFLFSDYGPGLPGPSQRLPTSAGLSHLCLVMCPRWAAAAIADSHERLLVASTLVRAQPPDCAFAAAAGEVREAPLRGCSAPAEGLGRGAAAIDVST